MDLSCPPLTALWSRLAATLQSAAGWGTRFSGPYGSWAEARAASSGYERPEILDKVAAATARVVRGEAAYERDSVAFPRREYPERLISALLRAVDAKESRELVVLDFGGSLGSAYFQCRPFLPAHIDLYWTIVEQAHYVSRGRGEFETDRLRFCGDIGEAAARRPPDLALLSGVLQYLEDPYLVLRQLGESGARHLLIDRTPLCAASDDRLVVQHVPADIYPASYPCRILSYAALIAALAPAWNLVAEFPAFEGWGYAPGGCFRYCGMLLDRRPA